MENLNRVLLENVLPAHVAEHFLGRNWKNEVSASVFFFFVCFSPALTVRWCFSLLPENFPLLPVSVILSGAANLWLHSPPLFPLLLHLFHSPESNYFFPAAVTLSQR